MDYDNYCWNEINDCLEYIEQEIIDGRPYKQIMTDLEVEFSPRYGTMRNNFRRFFPYSIGRYVRRRLLTEAYIQMKKDDLKLSTRSAYCGFEKYTTKFKDAFGFGPEGDYDIEELQAKLDVDEFRLIYECLNKLKIVKSFRFYPNHASIELNHYETVKALLRSNAYILPSLLESYFHTLATNEKILLLEMTTSALHGEKKRQLSMDDIDNLFSCVKLYDFSSPNLLSNGNLVFVPKVPNC